MCMSCNVYPLVKFSDGKRKVLFDCDFKLTSLEEKKEIENFMNNGFVYDKISSSKIKHYNLLNNDFVSLESFVSIPCGHCEECLKNNARNWSIRILEEAKQYKNNYFITLTYDDNNLPKFNSLVKDEISKFNKKLRTYLTRKGCNSDFRFYGVGEYGSNTFRPHYHVIYFNLDLPDLKFFQENENHQVLYKSKFLEDCWCKGQILIGRVEIGSACYVARYCDKKKNLSREDLDNLKRYKLIPEFSIMSRNPGIGANYLNKLVDNLKNGVYRIQYKDNNFSIPKYYKNKFDLVLDSEVLEKFKDYNNLVSNIFTDNMIKNSSLFDIEDYKCYTEFNNKERKKKRGF